MAQPETPRQDEELTGSTEQKPRVIRNVDVLNDEYMRRSMATGSYVILSVGLVVWVIWRFLLDAPREHGGGIAWFVALVVVSIVALPVHELVHAAAFKIMGGPGTKVSFDVAPGMLTTSAEGTILSRGRFCAVLLAPAVLLSCVFLIVCGVLGLPMLGWWLFVIHLSGCTGDLSMAWVIVRTPEASRVEDCDFGIRLLA